MCVCVRILGHGDALWFLIALEGVFTPIALSNASLCFAYVYSLNSRVDAHE